MSKIDNLIKQLCPKGVEKKKLKSLGSFYGGLSGKSKEDFEKGNAVFISYKNIYSNPSLDIHPSDRVYIQEGEKQTVIQYGDILFTGSSETPDECGFSSVVTDEPEVSMYLNSFCFGYRLNSLQAFNLHFLKLLFRSSELRKAISKTASGVTRYNVSKKLFGEIEIPLPPLHIQEEIVRILDKMVEQQQTIEKLIELRKKQYEYYREELLKPKEGWVTKTLGEIFELRNGYTPSKNNPEFWGNGDIPWYRMEDIRDRGRILSDSLQHITSKAIKGKGLFKENSFILATTATIGEHALLIADSLANQRFTNLSIRKSLETDIDVMFIYYYMFIVDEFCKEHTNVSGFESVDMNALKNMEISYPSVKEQEEIANALDKFESCISELTQTLEVCKKRYTHYRDELLRF